MGTPGFQSNIQENKDWNTSGSQKVAKSGSTFRATSKRTRIETTAVLQCVAGDVFFQSNIQENKDWNSHLGHRIPDPADFQSNIQENKDWNIKILSFRFCLFALSEQHPREQGLKHHNSYCSARAPPAFQSNIQENKDWNFKFRLPKQWEHLAFRATSKRTRIETRPDPKRWRSLDLLSEQHPREQGLKPRPYFSV